MDEKHKKEKVMVALSGGVDSAVAASLLLKKGYKVGGAFAYLVDNNYFAESLKAAKIIAKRLDFPFFVFDLSNEFKKTIIDSYLGKHKAGFTPNPCVICNKEIKAKLLIARSLEKGFSRIATGHYVRRKINSKGQIELWRGLDKGKDQSYFLHQLNQSLLGKMMFPLGSLLKSEVKEIADGQGIKSMVRPDSQELCFVVKSNEDFFHHQLGEFPGEIVNTENQIIGQHQGLYFYTTGQRKGIGLGNGPYYVLKKDKKFNRLVVTKDRTDLQKKGFQLSNLNWIQGQEPLFPFSARAQIRYQTQAQEGRLVREKAGKYYWQYSAPQSAITLGQSAVFYQGQQMMGGGIII